MRVSERQRASGYKRPAWPGNAIDVAQATIRSPVISSITPWGSARSTADSEAPLANGAAHADRLRPQDVDGVLGEEQTGQSPARVVASG
jgi:hypothetical protein